MHLTFSKQAALGLGAFLVVTGTFAATWLSLPKPVIDAARFVPAKETVAFFRNLTKESASTFAKNFPILDQVPLTNTPSSVAILKTGSGLVGWAILEPQEGKNPFVIHTSDPAFDAMLQTVDAPLGRSYAYASLLPEPTDTVSGWLRFPDISLSRTSALAPLIRLDHPAMISETADGVRIRFSTPTDMHMPALGSGPKEIFARPLFIFHVSNAAAFLETLKHTLQPQPLLVSETLLREALTSLFGKDLSPAYDLPPLLRGMTTIGAALSDDSQSLRVVLEGQLRDRKDLDHLTTLFRSTLGSVTRTTQTFDEKFHWSDIRKDTNMIEEIESKENGWSITSIRQKETGRALWSAVRGNRFILSNDKDALQKSVSQESSTLSASDTKPPSGLGLIDTKAASAFLSRRAPTIWPNREIPSGTGGYLKWKITDDGDRMTVLFKKI